MEIAEAELAKVPRVGSERVLYACLVWMQRETGCLSEYEQVRDLRGRSVQGCSIVE